MANKVTLFFSVLLFWVRYLVGYYTYRLIKIVHQDAQSVLLARIAQAPDTKKPFLKQYYALQMLYYQSNETAFLYAQDRIEQDTISEEAQFAFWCRAFQENWVRIDHRIPNDNVLGRCLEKVVALVNTNARKDAFYRVLMTRLDYRDASNTYYEKPTVLIYAITSALPHYPDQFIAQILQCLPDSLTDKQIIHLWSHTPQSPKTSALQSLLSRRAYVLSVDMALQQLVSRLSDRQRWALWSYQDTNHRNALQHSIPHFLDKVSSHLSRFSQREQYMLWSTVNTAQHENALQVLTRSLHHCEGPEDIDTMVRTAHRSLMPLTAEQNHVVWSRKNTSGHCSLHTILHTYHQKGISLKNALPLLFSLPLSRSLWRMRTTTPDNALYIKPYLDVKTLTGCTPLTFIYLVLYMGLNNVLSPTQMVKNNVKANFGHAEFFDLFIKKDRGFNFNHFKKQSAQVLANLLEGLLEIWQTYETPSEAHQCYFLSKFILLVSCLQHKQGGSLHLEQLLTNSRFSRTMELVGNTGRYDHLIPSILSNKALVTLPEIEQENLCVYGYTWYAKQMVGKDYLSTFLAQGITDQCALSQLCGTLAHVDPRQVCTLMWPDSSSNEEIEHNIVWVKRYIARPTTPVPVFLTKVFQEMATDLGLGFTLTQAQQERGIDAPNWQEDLNKMGIALAHYGALYGHVINDQRYTALKSAKERLDDYYANQLRRHHAPPPLSALQQKRPEVTPPKTTHEDTVVTSITSPPPNRL